MRVRVNGWVVVIALAVIAAAPLFASTGFLNTRQAGDAPFLLFRVQQLWTALKDGVFPVRWMPDGAFGLGYPFFHYYASLPYYVAAGFRALGASYVLCLKLTVLLGAGIASAGMFGWVRAITGRQAEALLAAAAYTFAPYHLVNVYLRGDSLAEFWAMAWYPLILWALFRAAQRPTRRRIAAVALAYGALMITHNVSALLFSPFVVLYGVVLAAAPGARLRRLVLLAAGGVLGIALAAWFWVPALREQDVVQLEDQTSGYFFYGGHFRGDDLIQPSLVFDQDVLSADANPFSMGLMQAILTGAGALAVLGRMVTRRTWARDGVILAGLVLATLMITPRSEWLWAHVPLLEFAQFPWRFLSVQAVFGAAAVGALAGLFPAGSRRNTGIALVAGAALAGAALGGLDPDFLPITDRDVTPERLMWYEAFSGNIGTTIRYEYLPEWTQPRPYTSDVLLGRAPRAKFLSGEGIAQRVAAGAASQEWTVTVMGEGAQVALPLLYWPGWKAEIDGQRVDLAPLEGPGYAQLAVPGGSHTVRLWLGQTPLRLSMDLLSLAALGIVLALIVRRRITMREWPLHRYAWIVGLGTVFLLALRWWPAPDAGADLLTADFDQRAYFHPAPDGVRYTDGTRLESAAAAVTGVDFEMLLTWDAAAEDVAHLTLAPAPQQVFLNAPGYPVVEAQPVAPSMAASRDWSSITPGLYFPRLTLFPAGTDSLDDAASLRAQTGSDHGRGALYLAPVIVPPGGRAMPDDAIPSGAALGPLRLLGASTAPDQDHLILTVWWQTMVEAPLNYGVDIAITDAGGTEWIRFNAIAGGAGLYPTALWSPGEIVPDAYRVTLPDGMPAGDYRLRVALYNPLTLETVAQTEIDGLRQPVIFPYSCAATSAIQVIPGVEIDALAAESPVLQGDPLPVGVDWVITQARTYDLIWTLSQDGRAIWQTQTPLAPGADSRDWTGEACGALVRAKHRLPLPKDLSPGEYDLALQLADASGNLLGDPLAVDVITVTGRDRVFDVPPLDTRLDALFGGAIRLWGYDLRQTPDDLAVTLAWGAETDPGADYKFFVHLYGAQDTGVIVDQIDTMPQGYGYPTSQWVAGEVVEDTLTFDLRAVPPGDYVIAVGWYDPASGDRLPVTALDATVLADQRLILPDTITVP